MIQKLKRTWIESNSIKALLLLVCGFIVVGILNLITSYALGAVTDGLTQKETSNLQLMLLILALGFIVTCGLNFFINRYQTKIIEQTRTRFKTKTIESIIESKYSYRLTLEQGDMIGRLNNDVSSIATANSISMMLFKAIIMLMLYAVGLLIIDARILFVFISPFPIIIVAQYFSTKYSTNFILPWKEAMGETDALVQDVMNNRTTIRVFQLYPQVKQWTDKALKKSAHKGIRGIAIMYAMVFPVVFLTLLPIFLIAIFGTYWISVNQMTLTQLISAITIAGLAGNEFNTLTNSLQNLPQLLASSERVFPIWDAPKENFGDYSGDGVDGEPIIEFKNVSFKYPGDDGEIHPLILDNLSFKINLGEQIGLVGTSGSGKSTIQKLILGLYQPTRGEVLIKGIPVQVWNQKVLRKKISMVSQNASLFNQSIIENLKYADQRITETEVKALLESVSLESLVQEELEVNRNVGEKGSNLSGGQRQRLTILRALLRNSELYIFDEATSALDTETEKVIQKVIDDFSNDKTQLMIAHRLSTLKSCDRILVIDKGCVVETGSHGSLMEQKAIYYKLYEQQKGEDMVHGNK